MTRSQRRIRNRKLGQLRSETRTFAAGVSLTENPNRGKHHAARMTDAFLVELARAERKSYRPLTVSTPLMDKNGHPRAKQMGHSSYTV